MWTVQCPSHTLLAGYYYFPKTLALCLLFTVQSEESHEKMLVEPLKCAAMCLLVPYSQLSGMARNTPYGGQEYTDVEYDESM